MNYIRGLVVRSKAGHDQGGFFTVLSSDERYAVICDGKRRSLEHPKKKKKFTWLSQQLCCRTVRCKPIVKLEAL